MSYYALIVIVFVFMPESTRNLALADNTPYDTRTACADKLTMMIVIAAPVLAKRFGPYYIKHKGCRSRKEWLKILKIDPFTAATMRARYER